MFLRLIKCIYIMLTFNHYWLYCLKTSLWYFPNLRLNLSHESWNTTVAISTSTPKQTQATMTFCVQYGHYLKLVFLYENLWIIFCVKREMLFHPCANTLSLTNIVIFRTLNLIVIVDSVWKECLFVRRNPIAWFCIHCLDKYFILLVSIAFIL